VTEWIFVANMFFVLYYCAANLAQLVLLAVSVVATVAQQHRIKSLWLERLRASALAPPISILVPARNEAKNIVQNVRSLLNLDYPDIQVVVANDGSTDDTLRELRTHFHLVRTNLLHVSEIPTRPVRGVYVSQTDPRLIVLDKESAGRKADALNAALNAATSPYVCAIDADTVLERDALLRIMVPVLTDPKRIIASGGIVRLANGTVIDKGTVGTIRLPKRTLEVLQVVEYLRAFLVGRQGWAQFNMLLIVSGAFGVFRRDILRECGGFLASTVGEDLDLVVRMHRLMRDRGEDYRVSFVSDPVCWTEAPASLRSLAQQRARWQTGLLDVLWRNRNMLFRRRDGRVAFVALPYQWLFEGLAPVIEVFGWAVLVGSACLGMASARFLLEVVTLGYLLGVFVSVGAVVIEEMTYHRYNGRTDLLRLVFTCFLEHFPYHSMHAFWRLRGLWNFVARNNDWRTVERVGFAGRDPVPSARR
jgi:cellulose synthase/poly-beta-1,6-N-acetylglucosamine synthase-like glycosyltransferase